MNRVLDITDRLPGRWVGWFQRLFSFLLVGGFGTVVNMVCFSIIYYSLVRLIDNLVVYFIAFIAATEVSIVSNFVLNDHITFRHLHGHSRSWQARCLRYHITSGGGTALTLGISFSLLHVLHISALLAQAMALIAATGFNFVFHHIFTYHQGHEKTSTGRGDQPMDHQAASRWTFVASATNVPPPSPRSNIL